ncbi:MAG: hypothetical protein WBL50_27890 [Candidatus Acidiferrum sp.]
MRRFFNPGYKPFCARCGWNLERAEAAFNANSAAMKFLPLVIAAIGLFAAFAAIHAHSRIIFIFPAVFLLIGLAPLWNNYSTRKALAAAKNTVNPGLAPAQPPLDPSLQMLRSLPRPRQVRFRLQGGSPIIIVLGLVAIASAMAFAAMSNHPHSNHSPGFAVAFPFLFILLIFGTVLIAPYLQEKRNRPLLSDGEVTVARVTAQRTIQQGKASYSRIDYEFKTNTGEVVRNSCRDLSGLLFEDMTIPVFYDSLDPSKNVAACASYLRIVNTFQ